MVKGDDADMKNTTFNTVAADILCDIAGSFALAIGIYCFAEQADIAPGGVSGIAIMIKYLFDAPVGLVTFLLNVPLLFLAWKYFSHRFTLRTLKTVLFNTIILDYVVTPYFPQYAGDRMLSSIFGGILMGVGLALIFLRGSTTGGTDIVSHLMELKFPHVPIGTMLLLIDCVILGVSILVFGNLESGLFGVVALFCQSKVIDGVIYGLDRGKTVMIMSIRNETIARRVMDEMEHGATFLKGRGAYTGREMDVLYVVVRVPEFHRLKQITYEEDPDAFLVVGEANQIIGEGFKGIREEK